MCLFKMRLLGDLLIYKKINKIKVFMFDFNVITKLNKFLLYIHVK